MAALKPGVLRANVVEDGATTRLELATSEGFMQALPDRVTVLVDEALAFDDVDVAKRATSSRGDERQKPQPPMSSCASKRSSTSPTQNCV